MNAEAAEGCRLAFGGEEHRDGAADATRMPLPPDDQDIRFGNVAHPSLQFEEHLSPGDPVGVHDMSLEPLAFALPTLPVAASARYDTGERVVARTPIDTVSVAEGGERTWYMECAREPTFRGVRR
ncbi:DUF2169 domain-containing protein [Sorangium sp. So ce513]|uniref:DUF2169 domain-containing protein n=1 Tax=Sorangium sp. So ce513 TaxID=3133315 RepID=UPI003F6450CE